MLVKAGNISFAKIVSLLFIWASILALDGCTVVSKNRPAPVYPSWDGPVQTLQVFVENTERGYLRWLTTDELYPLVIQRLQGNPYIRQRFDITEGVSHSRCNYELKVRFIYATSRDFGLNNLRLGRAVIHTSGKVAEVTISGRLTSCVSGRVVASVTSTKSSLVIGSLGDQNATWFATRERELMSEALMRAAREAIDDVVDKLVSMVAYE